MINLIIQLMTVMGMLTIEVQMPDMRSCEAMAKQLETKGHVTSDLPIVAADIKCVKLKEA